MNRSVLPISVLAFLAVAVVSPVVADATTLAKGVKLDCPAPGSWRFDVSTGTIAPGVETVRVTMKSDVESPPPRFSLRWFVPQTDIHHLWTSESTHYGIPWSEPMNSELAAWMPLYDFLDANDHSRFAFASSEARRKVVFKAPVSETQMGFNCSFTFFTVPEARPYFVRGKSVSARFLPGRESVLSPCSVRCETVGGLGGVIGG